MNILLQSTLTNFSTAVSFMKADPGPGPPVPVIPIPVIQSLCATQ